MCSGKSQLWCSLNGWDCTDWPQGTWDLCEPALSVKGPQEFSRSLSQKLCWSSNHVPCFIKIWYLLVQVLAIPAVPLTMSAGLIFGTLYGTILVSISGTVCSHFVEYGFVWRSFESLCNHVFLVCSRLNKNLHHWQTQHIWNVANCKLLQLAATVAFLIARYLARDRILKLAKDNKKFLAIDKAIGEDGFRVVTLLRLSPLLPFSLGNYLYGLTSVQLGPYVLGRYRD